MKQQRDNKKGFSGNRGGSRGGRPGYNKNRGGFGGGSRSGFGGGRREQREMHKAICSQCKKECEVPFKPTQGKPVYCRECFQNRN